MPCCRRKVNGVTINTDARSGVALHRRALNSVAMNRLTRTLVAGAGVAAGGLAAAALVWGGYQTPQPVLAVAVVLSLAVGWSFIFVGLAAASTRPDSQIGALMIGTGFAALARDVGAIDSHLGFALGRGVEDIAICMVGHLLISFPSGRLQGRTQRPSSASSTSSAHRST